MERKRIDLNPQQAELPLAPPSVPRKLIVDPIRAKELADTGCALSGLTPWLLDPPGSNGYYNVRQKSAREADVVRWWFSALTQKWQRPNDTRSDGGPTLSHDEFCKAFVWQGLLNPAKEYSYPLYTADAGLRMAASSDEGITFTTGGGPRIERKRVQL